MSLLRGFCVICFLYVLTLFYQRNYDSSQGPSSILAGVVHLAEPTVFPSVRIDADVAVNPNGVDEQFDRVSSRSESMWIAKPDSTVVISADKTSKLAAVESSPSSASGSEDNLAKTEQRVDSEQSGGIKRVAEDEEKRGEEVDSNEHVGKQNTKLVDEQIGKRIAETSDVVSESTAEEVSVQNDVISERVTDKDGAVSESAVDEVVERSDVASESTSEEVTVSNDVSSEQTVDKDGIAEQTVDKDGITEQTSDVVVEKNDEVVDGNEMISESPADSISEQTDVATKRTVEVVNEQEASESTDENTADKNEIVSERTVEGVANGKELVSESAADEVREKGDVTSEQTGEESADKNDETSEQIADGVTDKNDDVSEQVINETVDGNEEVSERTGEESDEKNDVVAESTAEKMVDKNDETSERIVDGVVERNNEIAESTVDDVTEKNDVVAESTAEDMRERKNEVREQINESGSEQSTDEPDKGDDNETIEDKNSTQAEDSKDSGEQTDHDDETSDKAKEVTEQTVEESNEETPNQSEDSTTSIADSVNLPTHEPLHQSHGNRTKTIKQKRKAKAIRPKFGSRYIFSKKSSAVQNVALDLTIEAIPPLPSSKSRLSLVLFTTADASHNYQELKVLNILQMFNLFQREFNFKGIVFTRTPSIRNAAMKLNIQVISDFPLNRYNMPIVGAMYTKAVELYDSEYYGYINSDILVSVNLFEVLELCRLNAEQGNINLRHEIAGRVSEVPTYGKLTATDLVAYTKYMRNLSKQVRVLRHGHSADYFIFSRYFNFSDYKPVVIGRKKVDNYLLWIPHQPAVTKEDIQYTQNRWKTKGHLIDATYVVRGIHLGNDNYLHREIRDRVGASDKYWNLKYFTNIDGHHASLVYSHYTFRYFRGALNMNYISQMKKNREKFERK